MSAVRSGLETGFLCGANEPAGQLGAGGGASSAAIALARVQTLHRVDLAIPQIRSPERLAVEHVARGLARSVGCRKAGITAGVVDDLGYLVLS
jgi:hypothetical protein